MALNWIQNSHDFKAETIFGKYRICYYYLNDSYDIKKFWIIFKPINGMSLFISFGCEEINNRDVANNIKELMFSSLEDAQAACERHYKLYLFK